MKPSVQTIQFTYRQSRQLADMAWYIVQFWGVFSQSTIGAPFIQSLDQLSLHLGKAVNGKHKSELATAYELFQEAALWCDIARRRKLLTKSNYQEIYRRIKELKQFFESETD